MRIGTDIVEIERIRHLVERHGDRVRGMIFTEHEWAYCTSKSVPWPSFAARFAAKEAVSKAFGVGLFGSKLKWTSIEVQNDAYGMPHVRLDAIGTSCLHQCGATTVDLSLSHCKAYAVAMVVVSLGTTAECSHF